jgi:hypothetical protein
VAALNGGTGGRPLDGDEPKSEVISFRLTVTERTALAGFDIAEIVRVVARDRYARGIIRIALDGTPVL